MPVKYGENIVWADETTTEHLDAKCLKVKGLRIPPQKHQEESLAVGTSWWGAVFQHTALAHWWMNGKMYTDILDKNLLPSNRMMKMKRVWTFQQESDPKHSQGNSGFRKKKLKLAELITWPDSNWKSTERTAATCRLCGRTSQNYTWAECVWLVTPYRRSSCYHQQSLLCKLLNTHNLI